jgi:hypothetical protein
MIPIWYNLPQIFSSIFYVTMHTTRYAPIKYSINTPWGVVSMTVAAGYTVVGRFSDVGALRKLEPQLSIYELEHVLQGRRFTRWYLNNKKAVNALALAVPMFTMALFGIEPFSFLQLAAVAVPAFLPTDGAGGAIATAAGGGYSFWAGNGAILLHFLVVGFVTLIITTFLKFTGRGDLAPLVMFVGGAIILYEVLGLFKAIYTGIATFFQM